MQVTIDQRYWLPPRNRSSIRPRPKNRSMPMSIQIRVRISSLRRDTLLTLHANAERIAMKIVVFVLAAFAMTAGIGTSAQAQNYPWCAVLNMGDAAYNCGFVSRQQCMASVSGIGGFCQENNLYQPPATSRASWPRGH